MTSNQRRFTDRNPSILAAGKSTLNLDNTVANCFKNYSLDDAKNALRFISKDASSQETLTPKHEAYKNNMRKGIFTQVRHCLQPKIQTRYQILINELKETSYDSHWNKVVGGRRDPIPGLPKGMNPLEVTFGLPSNRECTVKDLINPPKTVYQVLEESQACHNLYKKSHNDYNVGEKICRNYTEAFDESKTFGMRTKYDSRGIWVRCACTWHKNEPVVFTNKTQANFLNKSHKKLEAKLPEDYTYGTPNKQQVYGTEELLKDSDCPPCTFKRDLKCWLSSFNKLKLHVKNRFGTGFTLDDLRKRFLYHDVEKCDTLPLNVFYEICFCYGLTFNRKNIEPLLRLLAIICNNEINYVKFLEIVNFNSEPITLIKINDIPQKHQYYITSSQAAVCDYLIINNADSPVAGIPSIRHDLPRPIVPLGGCRADLENLGDECSAGILLNPTIYMNYGLSFRDFFIPRDYQTIRNLFTKSGHSLDDTVFEKLWLAGVDMDKTGMVCVDTFNKLLQKYYNEQRKLQVDELSC